MPAFLQSTVALHGLGPLSLICILVSVFSQEKKLDIFAFHVLFMTFAVLVFLAEGLLCYNEGALPRALFPIMQGPSRTTQSQLRKTRVVHRALQVIATIMVLLGLTFILVNKMRNRRSVLPHSLHGWVGLVAVALVVLQATTGFVKFNRLVMFSKKSYRWHNRVGMFLFDLLVLSLLLGLATYVSPSFLALLAVLLLACFWVVIHQSKKTEPSEESAILLTEEKNAWK